MIQEKRCSKCGEAKRVSAFYPNGGKGRDGLQAHCKDCDKAIGESRYGTSSRRRTMHKSNLKNYGLTINDYDRMLAEQDGGCAICGVPPGQMEPSNGHRRLLSVDHNHHTGVIRGLLCHKCNVGLGAFGDKLELVEAAADYLRSGRVFVPARLL